MKGPTASFLSVLALLVAACGNPGARPGGDRPSDTPGPRRSPQEARFVGTETCRPCHEAEHQAWAGSDHDLAMDVATEATVLGDFDDAAFSDGRGTARFTRREGRFLVETEGPTGAPEEFEISHVFGHDPLQQYLVPFPGGRLQALDVSWDTVRGGWFRQYPGREIPPDDWLHWTRAGQNWNGMCAECHSTNLVKGYDPETDTYATTWTELDVGCEACHGAGSRHVAWASSAEPGRPTPPNAGFSVASVGLGAPDLVELCAPCHSRRAELGDWRHSGGELLDDFLPTLLEEGLYHPDGQVLEEVYVYGSFLQSRMHAEGVSCRDCHDSHSLGLRREGNALCLECHEAPDYDTPAHHFHFAPAEASTPDPTACVRCHMVERPFMVIDWRADHSFRVPRPDLTEKIGVPNACSQSGCHADRTAEWAAAEISERFGAERPQHFGRTFAAARNGDPATVGMLATLVADETVPSIVRATAVSLLAGISDPRSLASLRSALDDPDALVRRTAVARLPLTSAPDVRRLEPSLDDPIRAVRLAATRQLAAVPRNLLTAAARKSLDLGVGEFRTAMRHLLDFAASAFDLATLEASLGDPRTAEELYRRALEIDDAFLPARANLAVLLGGLGRLDEAEALLRKILETAPDRSDIVVSLGLLRVEQGDLDEAERLLRAAARARPRDASVRRNLGLLLLREGRSAEAEEMLRAAVEIAPADIAALHAFANLLLREGRREEALVLAERMIEIDPDDPTGHQLRAMARR